MRPPPDPGRSVGRSSRTLLVVGVALLMLTGSALAWVTLNSASTVTVGVIPPPVRFEVGDGATRSRYIEDPQLTLNKTGFTATITGRVGAEIKVKDVVRVTSADDGSQSVTLRANKVTNVNIETFRWTVKNGSTTIGTLDLTSPSPSVAFTLPPGGTFVLDLQLRVAKGAGKNNATEAFSMWVVL